MTFKTRKDTIYGIVIWGSVVLILFSVIGLPIIQKEDIFSTPFVILILLIGFPFTTLMIWIWFGTYYKLEGGFLYYKSGPLRGKIEIKKISKIYLKASPWVGVKPVLSFDSILVVYNKYDEVFLSPLQKQQFISNLLNQNSEIKIIEKY